MKLPAGIRTPQRDGRLIGQVDSTEPPHLKVAGSGGFVGAARGRGAKMKLTFRGVIFLICMLRSSSKS